MTFEIESDVPMPQSHSRGSSYPLAQLKVGESFLIEGTRTANAVRSTFYARCKVLGIAILAREVDGGVRVWRKS